MWRYADELTTPTANEKALQELGIIPDYTALQASLATYTAQVFAEATLPVTQNLAPNLGGKQGRHSEYLGYLLAELQYMQRTYPGLKW